MAGNQLVDDHAAQLDRLADCVRDIRSKDAEITRLQREVEDLKKGWMTIDSAPKDGTQILARSEDGTVQVAHWSSNGWAYGGGSWPQGKVTEWKAI